MTDRREWVKCALMATYEGDPPKPTMRTWCSRIEIGWAFTDANHALLNGLGGGRAMLCADCAVAIKGALKAGSARGQRKKKVEAEV